MQTSRQVALQFEEFLKREWPLSESYFGIMAVNNSRFIAKIRSGRLVRFGTVERAQLFVENYRRNPERTMELARANLYRTKNKKPARPARKGQSRSSRVAA